MAKRAREVWAAGDWDVIARHVQPVGARVLERVGVEPGMDLLDVGTGTGKAVAIPAALRRAKVVGSDITPELLAGARRHADEAGVAVEWVEADAQELPFADASFDRVISTFGAMFAPDHRRAAAELVRVCRPGGTIGMATWAIDGFSGEFFKLSSTFMPPAPETAELPVLWGVEEHIAATFSAAGVGAEVTRETVHFEWPSAAAAVREYTANFGPILTLRGILEPQGRWPEYVEAFTRLIERFDQGVGSARVGADYLLITAERTRA